MNLKQTLTYLSTRRNVYAIARLAIAACILAAIVIGGLDSGGTQWDSLPGGPLL